MNDFLIELALRERSKLSLYLVLWRLVGEKPGVLPNVCVAELVGACARRGIAFSETQIRSRLRELKKVKLIDVVKREKKKGVYSIYINGDDCGENRRETNDNVERDLNDDDLSVENAEVSGVDGREGAQETDAANFSENSPLKKNNNINNKKINKPTNRDFLISNSEESRENDDAVSPNGCPSTDEIRRRVNFANPKIAKLRNAIARLVWEPSVNPDLIDRVAAAVVLGVGGANWNLVQGLVKAAVAEAKKTTDATFRKAEPIWRFLTLPIKRLYENAGWTWTKTRIATEPKPVSPVAMLEETERAPKPVDASSSAPRPVATTRRPERPETPEQLRAKTMGITFADVQKGIEFCVEKIVAETDWHRTTALNYASIAIGAAKKLNEIEMGGRYANA